MYVGQTTSKGTKFIRCTDCGDSSNPKHAHCEVYQDGGTHCHRCKVSHKGTLKRMIEMLETFEDVELDQDEWTPIQGKLTFPTRKTALPTYICAEGFYTWNMRTPQGRTVGQLYRAIDRKSMYSHGAKGLGFVGERLQSSPSSPLIVVEGPYDCITDRHCTVFGTLSKSVLKRLKLHYIWLFPDGDWIDTKVKRERFEQMIRELVNDHMVFVLGYIVGDANDPDECTQLRHIRTESFLYPNEWGD